MNRVIAQTLLAQTKTLVRLDESVISRIRRNPSDKVIDIIAPLTLNALRPFVDVLTASMHEQARDYSLTEYLNVAAQRNVVLKANPIWPTIDDDVRKDVAKLVVQITTEQRRALKRVIERRFDRDSRANDLLIKDIKAVVGLTEREAVAVMNLRDSLIRRGLPPTRVVNEVDQYSSRLHELRAQRIARTETVRMQVEGKRAAYRSLRKDGILGPRAYLEWVAAWDCCSECRKLNGQTASLDGTFNTKYGKVKGPPAHPHCDCDIVARDK